MDEFGAKAAAFNEFTLYKNGFGLAPWKTADVINVFKAGTLPVMLVLMLVTGNTTSSALVYVGLHGGYGLVWILKDFLMPDKSWQRQISWMGTVSVSTVLLLYWYIGYVTLTTVRSDVGWIIVIAILFFAVGVCLMIGSDVQKNCTLLHKQGLITTGFFARTRNPNYLGEILIYASFALLSRSFVCWLIVASVWGGLFLPNMIGKDKSLSRHPGWAAYKAKTGLLLPNFAK